MCTYLTINYLHTTIYFIVRANHIYLVTIITVRYRDVILLNFIIQYLVLLVLKRTNIMLVLGDVIIIYDATGYKYSSVYISMSHNG